MNVKLRIGRTVRRLSVTVRRLSVKRSGGCLLHSGYLHCDMLQLAGELKGGLTLHGIIMCSVCGGLQVSLTLVVGLLTVLELSGG